MKKDIRENTQKLIALQKDHIHNLKLLEAYDLDFEIAKSMYNLANQFKVDNNITEWQTIAVLRFMATYLETSKYRTEHNLLA